MLGFYENFPPNFHLARTFTASLTKRKLQEKILCNFLELNSKTFSFEEVANPTVPNCAVIFEFGIADANDFRHLDEEETKKVIEALSRGESFVVLDWFCNIRYHRKDTVKQRPLKFDYYMLRIGFSEKGIVEFLIFHERGPRYISPEDLVTFIERKINQTSSKKILKRVTARFSL